MDHFFVLCAVYSCLPVGKVVLFMLGIGKKVRKLWLLTQCHKMLFRTVKERSNSINGYLQYIAYLFVTLFFEEKENHNYPIFFRKHADDISHCLALSVLGEMK